MSSSEPHRRHFKRRAGAIVATRSSTACCFLLFGFGLPGTRKGPSYQADLN